MIKRLLLLIYISSTFLFHSFGQTVNIRSYINGFRHNWECTSDGGNSKPEPRYKIWAGYNGGNFVASSNGPGLLCGSPNWTYGGDELSCTIWNPGIITLPVFTQVSANTLSIRMQSWENDAGLLCCQNSNCIPNPEYYPGMCRADLILFSFDIPCVNPDDAMCGPETIGNIEYWQHAPCTDTTYVGGFDQNSFLSMHGRCDGGDYGVNQLIVNWDFFSSPTITLEPDAAFGTNTITICSGLPISIPFTVNRFSSQNWTLGRWVKWQVSNDNVNWSDIAGTLNGTAYTTKNDYSYVPNTNAIGTKYYRAMVSSDCSPNFATKTTTTHSVRIIVVDGTGPSCANNSCGIVYVDPNPAANGNDFSGNGNPNTPYRTISKALSTNPEYVRVAKGSGTDNGVAKLNNNVIVEGGYNRNGDKWDKSSTNLDVSTITFTGIEYNPDGNDGRIAHLAAFKSDGKSGWMVKDLNIITGDVPANTYATDGGTGISNYGFLLVGGTSNYTISRCNLTIGKAGAGKAGNQGADQAGFLGGDGGAGSAGAPASRNVTVQPGGTGQTGAGYNNASGGGAGGAGRSRSQGCSCDVWGADDGRAGQKGNVGITPVQSGSGSNYIANQKFFIPGGQGIVGAAGGGGQGGGGGSGSMGSGGCLCSCGLCEICDGENGAVGGKGGRGGGGGTGGYGGGGTFGAWLNSSGTGATYTETNLVSINTPGSGGAGGLGGFGALGASGGNKIQTHKCTFGIGVFNSEGGAGGDGGAGGRGGTGGNGVAGLQAAYISNGGTAPYTFPSVLPNYPNFLKIDYYLARSNTTGKACPNSEIDLSKGLPSNWILNGSLSLVNDIDVNRSSYTLASSAIKVTTNSSGFFDLQAGAGAANTFKNGLYVFPVARTLPVIDYPVSSICDGGTVRLSVTGWDETKVAEREWKVYDSLTVTPISGSPFTGTKSIAVTGFTSASPYKTYVVKYRERHDCCGWSRPVFALIRVYPPPTPDTIQPNPNSTNILCIADAVSATFKAGKPGLNCASTYDYYYNGNATSPTTYTPGTPIPHSDTVLSVTVRVRKICDQTPAANVTSLCNLDVSSSYTWTFVPKLYRGRVDTSAQTGTLSLCGSPTPTANSIPLTFPPTGSGSFFYKWYYKDVTGLIPPDCPATTDSIGTWIPATSPTANSAMYFPLNNEILPGHSRTYACLITPGPTPICGTRGWAEKCRQITVLPAFNPGALNVNDQTGPTSVCPATPVFNPISFSTAPVGSGSYRYRWFYKETTGLNPPGCPSSASDTTGWTRTGFADTLSTYTPSSIPAGKSRTYACFVIPASSTSFTTCGTAKWADSCRKITVLESFTIGTLNTGDQTLCASLPRTPPNSISFSALPTGSGGFTYQWYYKDATGFVGIPAPNCPITTSDSMIRLSANATAQSATYVPGASEIPAGTSRTYMCYVTPTNASGTSVACGNAGFANGCRKIVMLNSIYFGEINTSSELLCNGRTASTSQFDFKSGTGGGGLGGAFTPYGASSGLYNYQWYYKDGDFTPTSGTAPDTSWHAYTGTCGTCRNLTPKPSAPTSRSFALAVDPVYDNATGFDCDTFKWAAGRIYLNALPALNKGHLDGGEIICPTGVPSNPDPAKINFNAAVLPNIAPVGSGGWQYKWYYNKLGSGDSLPPAGSTFASANWTPITAAQLGTVANYDPPVTPPGSPLNTPYTTRSFAVMVNGVVNGATPDCDQPDPNNYQWADGRYLLKVVTAPGAPSATPSPAVASNLCANSSLVLTLTNPTQGTGGASTCSFQYQVTGPSGTIQPYTTQASPPTVNTGTYGAGTYTISIRTSCPCGFAASAGTTYTWQVGTPVAWSTQTVSPTAICLGGAVTLTGAVTPSIYGNVTWGRATTSGGSVTTVTTGDIPPSADTFYYRPIYTPNANQCAISDGAETMVLVKPDPVAPTGTASPATGVYCPGEVLSVIGGTIGAGGTGSCNLEYQTISPSGTSAWTTSVLSFPSNTTTTGGSYTIKLRSNCSNGGLGCNQPETSFAWTIAGFTSNTVTPTTLCLGASVTLAATATPAATVRWVRTSTSNGTDTTIVTSGNTPTDTGTYYYRPRYSGACTFDGPQTAVQVVAQPVPPTATKNPADDIVCAGQALSVTPIAGSFGTGICTSEYQSKRPNGLGGYITSVWTTTVPSFSSVTTTDTTGIFTIKMRRSCDGIGCAPDSVNTYSWTVVPDPILNATRTPAKDTVCAGQILTLTDIIDSTDGGTGNCVIEYQRTRPGIGTGAWSTTDTIVTNNPGYYTIAIRLNCDGLSCDKPVRSYTWYVGDDPLAPTGTRVPNTDTVCEGQVLSLNPIDNGGGTGICAVQYSKNGGAWSTALTPLTATVGINTIAVRKVCDGSDCDISGENTYTWVVVDDPATPTATKFPDYATVCSGSVLTLTSVADLGGGAGLCYMEYQTVTPSGGTSGWIPGSPPVINSTTVGTYTINARKHCNGSGCDLSGILSYSWSVVADPTLSAPSNDTICIGGSTSLRTNLTNGTGSFNFIWQYSDDQVIWSTVHDSLNLTYNTNTSSSGSTLLIAGNGSETAKNYYYRCFVVSTDSVQGCDAFSTVGRITIVSKPSLTNPLPASQVVCKNGLADTLNVTSSGGTTRPKTYIWLGSTVNSTSGGTPLYNGLNSPYLPLTADTGTFYFYCTVTQQQSGCSFTTAATAMLHVIDAPTILTTKSPNSAGICEGTPVSASISIVGGSGCTDSLQYEFDSTGTWAHYSTDSILSTINHTLIRIRAKRGNCGCETNFVYLRWGVNNKPDPNSAHVKTDPLCGLTVAPFAELFANDPSPYPGTWSITSGPGSISNSSSDTTMAINLTPGTPTTIRWFVNNNGCSDFKDTTITPSSTVMDPNTVALTNNCRNCTVRNGNTYTFYNTSGHIVAKIEDYSSPAVELAQTEVCLDVMPYTSSRVPVVYTSYADTQPYLPRRWTISPADTTSLSHVTLYFKKAEFDALQAHAVGTHYQFSNLSDLAVTKFKGGSNGSFTNPPWWPSMNASAVLMSPVFKKYPSASNGPDYSVEFDISSYSTFYVHPMSFPFAPLPVELVSFTGWNEGEINKLQWVTASEANTDKFEVQKSIFASNWTTIGQVPAAGHSAIPRTYSLTDNDPVIGNNYYRLKVVDLDGKISYSQVINIPNGEAVSNNFIRVFPNPTGGQLNIEIQSTGAYDTRIIAYDVVGKKVFEKTSSLTRGLNTLQYDFTSLSKGTYILHFSDNSGKTHTIKFVKD